MYYLAGLMMPKVREKTFEEFYRLNHINQSVDFVSPIHIKYGKNIPSNTWFGVRCVNKHWDLGWRFMRMHAGEEDEGRIWET